MRNNCCDCRLSLEKAAFAKSQLKKPAEARRCKICARRHLAKDNGSSTASNNTSMQTGMASRETFAFGHSDGSSAATPTAAPASPPSAFVFGSSASLAASIAAAAASPSSTCMFGGSAGGGSPNSPDTAAAAAQFAAFARFNASHGEEDEPDNPPLDEDEKELWDAVCSRDLVAVRRLFDEFRIGGSRGSYHMGYLAGLSDPQTEETILMRSCKNNDLAMVRLILERSGELNSGPSQPNAEPGGTVNVVDKRLKQAIHRAVEVQNDDMVEMLLDAGSHGVYDNFRREDLAQLKKSTNDRLKPMYEEMYGELDGGWPRGVRDVKKPPPQPPKVVLESCLFLSQPVDENLCCSLCLAVFDKPTTACSNGHTYCEECLEKARKQSNACPDCREPMADQALPSRPLQNIIMGMRLRCENHESPPGEKEGDQSCDWVGLVSEYPDHKMSCDFRMVTCNECADKVPARLLEEHTQSQACMDSRARIEQCSSDIVDVILSVDGGPEHKGNVLVQVLCSEQVSGLCNDIAAEQGIEYKSPEDYAGEGLNVSEEIAKELFARRVLSAMCASGPHS